MGTLGRFSAVGDIEIVLAVSSASITSYKDKNHLSFLSDDTCHLVCVQLNIIPSMDKNP